MNNDFQLGERGSLPSPQPIKPAPSSPAPRPPKKHSKLLFWRHIHLSRTQWILVGVGALLLLVGVTVAALAIFKKDPPPAPQVVEVVEEEPKPTTEPSRLTGIQVKPELNKRPVTGIMIENSPDARPQSGLLEAGVVFEAIAEGGITRFLALYQEAKPEYIGPVRSVRPYYIDWAMGYSASLAHVGGAPQALIDIRNLSTRDLDQFYNPEAYWRIEQRYAPHNMYTKMSNLDALNKKKGYTSSKFTSFARKEPGTLKSKKKATDINIAISGYLYNVHYTFDAKSNSYKRSQGGTAHKDQRSGKTLSPKVVVAFVIPRGIASDGQHTNYKTTGSGVALVFQDGRVTKATWKKSGRKKSFRLVDGNNEPLKLNPGQTWLTAIDSVGSVTYKP